MKTEIAPTYWVHVWMSGPIDVAKLALRQICFPGGLCVTIDATTYVYAGGEEAGFVVRFVNYPRFPEDPATILSKARLVAIKLLEATFQHSALIVTPETTEWMSIRPEGLR